MDPQNGMEINYEQNFIWALIMDPPGQDRQNKINNLKISQTKKKICSITVGAETVEEIRVGEALSPHKYTHTLSAWWQ